MDLDINMCKKRHLSNVRAAASEELVKLSPPRKMSLEEALIWIKEDELVGSHSEICAYKEGDLR